SKGNSVTTNFTLDVYCGISAHDVTADWPTAAGSATAGSDYTTASGSLTIPAGQIHTTLTVSVNGDNAAEPDEYFWVTLSNVTNATLAVPSAFGQIHNDDGTPTVPRPIVPD